MKKLYKKGQVHPSPSSSSPQTFDHQFSLSFLPATILTLATALSSQDKEVLAYLLSCSSTTPFHFDPSNKTHLNNNNNKNNHQKLPHAPSFICYCFTCYTYYWALWDCSPNRQLIHEIIDAFEDNLVSQNKLNNNNNNNKHGLSKREKRKKKNNNKGVLLSLDAMDDSINIDVNKSDYSKVNDDDVHTSNGLIRVNNSELNRVDSIEEVCDETGEKQGSNVRKIVSFIGERLWGSVWG